MGFPALGEAFPVIRSSAGTSHTQHVQSESITIFTALISIFFKSFDLSFGNSSIICEYQVVNDSLVRSNGVTSYEWEFGSYCGYECGISKVELKVSCEVAQFGKFFYELKKRVLSILLEIAIKHFTHIFYVLRVTASLILRPFSLAKSLSVSSCIIHSRSNSNRSSHTF
jgi:hypothetical protein